MIEKRLKEDNIMFSSDNSGACYIPMNNERFSVVFDRDIDRYRLGIYRDDDLNPKFMLSDKNFDTVYEILKTIITLDEVKS